MQPAYRLVLLCMLLLFSIQLSQECGSSFGGSSFGGNRNSPARGDSACTSRGGRCQDSDFCFGPYLTGYCSGPAYRRCCVDVSHNSASCTVQQQSLACDLFNSANIVAAQTHPSGVYDNAFAYDNLRDMCHGNKASRSSYTCTECNDPGAPGGTVCLSVDLLRYLVELQSYSRVIINELAGACHSCRSRHYSGLAVDLHKDSRSSVYLSKCEAMGGWGQDEGNHVHCQFYDQPHPNGF